jgi:flagellar protein FliO/FliZ
MIRFQNKSTLIILLTLIMLQIAVVPVLAADMDKLNQELDSQPQEAGKPNLVVEFIKLLVVLVLIVGAAWSIIKLFSRQATSRMQGTWLHVVDEVTLGQNKGIILCEVGEKVFAVGVTDHNISVLFEVTHPKLLEEISMEMDSKPTNLPVAGWQSLWDSISSKWGNAVPSRLPDNKTTDFKTLMEEQVKRIQNISSTSMGGPSHDADKQSKL